MPSTRSSARRGVANRSGGIALAATAGVVPQGTPEQLRQLKLALMATREKLLLVSPDLLNDAAHEAWSKQIFEVSMAINGVRNAELEVLSAEFRAELPAFSAATAKLVDDLFELQKATEVIKAVGSLLGIFTKIAKLAS